MTFVRHLVYGITPNGEKEFLHSFIDPAGGKEYVRKHKKIFPDRFVSYHRYTGDTFSEVIE